MSTGRAPPDGGGRPSRPAGTPGEPHDPRRDPSRAARPPRPGRAPDEALDELEASSEDPAALADVEAALDALDVADSTDGELDVLDPGADEPDDDSDEGPVLGHFEAAVRDSESGARPRPDDADASSPLLELGEGTPRFQKKRPDRDVFETLHGKLEAKLDALEDGDETARTDEPADDDQYDEDERDPLDRQHDALEARLAKLEAQEAAEGDDDGVLDRFESKVLGAKSPATPPKRPSTDPLDPRGFVRPGDATRPSADALSRAQRAAERATSTPAGGVPRGAVPPRTPARERPLTPSSDLSRPTTRIPGPGERPTRADLRPVDDPLGPPPAPASERPTRLDLRAEAVRSPAPAARTTPEGAPPPARPARAPRAVDPTPARGQTRRLDHQPRPPEGDDADTIERVTLALSPPTAEDVARTVDRAEKTVRRMERLGFDTDPLEGRLAAADVLRGRGELQAALHLCQEVLVLARTMIEVGPIAKPKDTLPERVQALFELHLEGEAFGQAVNARTGRIVAQVLEDTLAGPTFQSAVSRLLERRLDAHLEEEAFARAVRALLERRLESLLPGEPFQRAAAAGAAAFPDALLDRPELAARIDASIDRREKAFLVSGRLADKVRALVLERSRELTAELADAVAKTLPDQLGEQLLSDPRLAALADARVDEKLKTFLEGPAAQAALEARGQAWLQQAATSPLLAEAIEARVRARLDERLDGELFLANLDARTVAVLQSPEARLHLEAFMRGSAALGETIDERLERSEAFQRRFGEQLVGRLSELLPRLVQDLVEQGVARHRLDILDDGAFVSRVDEVARKRAEALVEAAGFKAAIDARIRALAEDVAKRIASDVDQRIAAATGDVAQAAAEKVLDSPALKARIDASAARATEVDHQRMTQKLGRLDEQRDALERKLESLVPVLVRTALAEGGPVEGRLKAIAEEAAKGAIDEAFVVRVIHKELTNREALRAAKLGGDAATNDPVTALLKSDAIRTMIAEEIEASRRKTLERRAARDTSKLRQSDVLPPTSARADRAEMDTQHEGRRRRPGEASSAQEPPLPRKKPPPPEVPRPPRRGE